jgi:hypothetical protein
MAQHALHALPPPETRVTRSHRAIRRGLAVVGAAFQRPASVAKDHLLEHGYFLAAMSCADAAGFVHSVFTGLIVAGASFLAIEWRVSR